MNLQRYIRGIRNKKFKKEQGVQKNEKAFGYLRTGRRNIRFCRKYAGNPQSIDQCDENCKALVEQAWVFGAAVPARCQAFNLDQSNKALPTVKQTSSRKSVAIKISKHRSSIAAKQG